MTTVDTRIRRCAFHGLRPRCPACETERHADGMWQTQTVPAGFAEWLRESARFYDSLGPISATEFATAIAVDLREAAT